MIRPIKDAIARIIVNLQPLSELFYKFHFLLPAINGNVPKFLDLRDSLHPKGRAAARRID